MSRGRWRRHARGTALALLLLAVPLGAPAAEPAPAPAQKLRRAPPVQPPAEVERVTLDEAVRRALAQNPTVAAADAQLRRADALLREARAGLLPTLTAQLTYTRLDNDRVLNDRVILAANQINLQGVLSVPLFDAQRWSRKWQAEDERSVVRAGSAEVRRTIALAAARAYLTTLLQHRMAESARRAQKNALEHLDHARRRREAGYGNRIDEVRAEQELVTTELQLESAYVSLVRAREALGVLCGAPGPLDVNQAAAGLRAPTSLPEALAEARASRADLRLLHTRVQAQLRLRRQLWTYYTPSLVGIFQPFLQSPPTLTLPNTGWQATLTLSLPLYDGGVRYAVRDEREALLQEARTLLDGAVRQAEAEVRTAFAVLERTRRSLARAQDGARLAARALELATLAYRAGAATNIEVVDAERRARDADTLVALAEDSVEQARLDLLVAAGRLP